MGQKLLPTQLLQQAFFEFKKKMLKLSVLFLALQLISAATSASDYTETGECQVHTLNDCMHGLYVLTLLAYISTF